MSKFLTPPVWYDKNGNLNDMLTGVASSYGVAVGSNADAIMGGVAVGYNASVDQEGVAVGMNATAKDYGIAIGSNVTSDGYGIAIGGNATGAGIAIGATATGNGIAIGGTAAANNVQLGNTDTTYDLTVGSGSGTLKIGSIAFYKQRISNNSAIIGTPGVYLCCITTPGDNSKVTSDVAICFIDSLNQPTSVLSSTADLCKYSSTTELITPKNGSTMKYCFKIISLN